MAQMRPQTALSAHRLGRQRRPLVPATIQAGTGALRRQGCLSNPATMSESLDPLECTPSSVPTLRLGRAGRDHLFTQQQNKAKRRRNPTPAPPAVFECQGTTLGAESAIRLDEEFYCPRCPLYCAQHTVRASYSLSQIMLRVPLH